MPDALVFERDSGEELYGDLEMMEADMDNMPGTHYGAESVIT